MPAPTSPFRRTLGVLTSLGLLILAGAPVWAEDVGIAIKVQPGVRASPPRDRPRDLRAKDRIERGTKVTLKKVNPQDRPLLQILFNEQFACRKKEITDERSVFISDFLTLRGASDAELGNDSEACNPKIKINVGPSIRLARLPGGDRPTQVETPHARVLVKGTYLRMSVDPVVGTFVAVDEGTVSVEAKAGGDPVEVRAGQWVVVPPGGPAIRPAPLPPEDGDEVLEDPPLLGCCTRIGPPKPPG